MFNGKNKGKIKNEKVQRWRLELACFNFDIAFRSGSMNTVADALSRVKVDEETCAIATSTSKATLEELHAALCHPGVTRFWHAVRVRNLPFSLDDVRGVVRRCSTCAQIKPQFVKTVGRLVKATRPSKD